MPDGYKHLDFFLFFCLLVLAAPVAIAWGQQESPPPSAAQTDAEPKAAAQAPQVPEGVKRVTYVPEVVKAEIREQVKREVLEEIQKNDWAAPHALPEWTKRIRLMGDARLRYEVDNFGRGNAVDYYPDFNGINSSGKPFDVNFRDPSNERWLDTTQRRSRILVRARLDMDADLGQGFATEIRLASGDTSSPVSTNQTAGGSNGNFSKFQAWIDRLGARYQPWRGDAGGLVFRLGRFENPFFRTDLTWDESVNFDGAAMQGNVRLGGGFRPFLNGGAFPLYNTSFDFPSQSPDKIKSRDKWLYAGQIGTEWKPIERLSAKVGLSFFFFDRVRGITSSDCDTNLSYVTCDTDASRPSFAQKGNTYFPLRTPSIEALDAELNNGASRYQFFGLASGFRNLVYTGRVDFLALPKINLRFDGEYVRNVAFHAASITSNAVTNFKACAANDSACQANPPYGGGNVGYLARLTVGSPDISHRWDWNVAFTYRYLESDAFLDAFPNSEFALGGTNNKGFVASATLAVADRVDITARWLSSNVIVGPQFSIDVFYVDMNVRY